MPHSKNTILSRTSPVEPHLRLVDLPRGKERERNLFRTQEGRQVFEVECQALLRPNGALSEPVLIEIRHHSTEWDSPTSTYLSS